MVSISIRLLAVAAVIFSAAVGPAVAASAATVGATYIYRLANGYNQEPRGQLTYRVEAIEADRTVVSVTPDSPALGLAYAVVYSSDGNWLRHPLTNHDQPVQYEFAQPYPAYMLPLEPGKSWSVRVNATVPGSGIIRSVRVDGAVIGTERIHVPAGEFDTLKIRRLVYAGDWDSFLRETNIIEVEWYAPALGRPVRSESKSEWLDLRRCGRSGCQPIRGDWNVYELVAVTP